MQDHVGGFMEDKPEDFYLFSGDLRVHVYKTTQGNYTLR